MEKDFISKIADPKTRNVHVSNCGICTSEPLESFGPAVKPHYLLLYLFDGRMAITLNGEEYQLYKKMGFLVPPDKLVHYIADKKDPCTYAYISFDGNEAAALVEEIGLSLEKPLFKSPKQEEINRIISQMLEHNNFTLASELKRDGLFKVLLSVFVVNSANTIKTYRDRSEHYVMKAIEFIRSNYCTPIKITDVADYVRINRSYLYTLFMDVINMSPHQYLADYRITRASDLLVSTRLSIESIALSCGYMDSLVFTKAFKQAKGISPSAYRKERKTH